MKKPVLVTFGEGGFFHKSKFRLAKEAILSDFFSRVVCLDKVFLSEKFKEKVKNLDHTRGYGYWFWKPYCVLKTLETLSENEILIWADAGCSINPLGKKRLNFYLDMLEQDSKIMLGFTMANTIQWTKRDLYVYTNTDYEFYHNSPLTIATIHFWKRTDETIDFLNHWYELALIDHLIDDSESIEKNYDQYIEHRHDQSILSLLCLKNVNKCVFIHKVPYYQDFNGDTIKNDNEPILITGLKDDNYISPLKWIYV